MKAYIGLLSVIAISVFSIACGGGGSTSPTSNLSTSTTPSTSTTSSKSWSGSSSNITIDNIVNATGSSKATREASSTSSFYYGRFVINTGIGKFSFQSGTFKFKIIKNTDATAYFSEFSLINFSHATNYDANTSIVSSETDLGVPSSYNEITNHISVTDASSRFVKFSVDFSNNNYFSDVKNAGIRFSDDYTTCGGGDDKSFIFLAQKSDTLPDASISGMEKNWKDISFSLNSDGIISDLGSATISINGNGGNGYTAFTGTSVNGAFFDGELALNDPKSGFFYFGYGSSVQGTTPTAISPSGLFLLSPDGELALGYDAINSTYFVAEPQ